MKKIVQLMLVFTIFLTSVNFGVVANENKNQKLFEKEFKLLIELKILDSTFDFSKNITRGEFVYSLGKLLHPKFDYSKGNYENPFNDVKSDNPYFTQIKVFKDLGIINGDIFKNFYPTKEITLIDAITITINALGYKPYADAKGGYPVGYQALANEIELLKGLSLQMDSFVSGDILCKFIYNALFVNIVNATVNDGNINISIDKTKNVLLESLSIVLYDAIIINDGITSIYDDTILKDNQIMIMDVKTNEKLSIDISDRNIASHLGERFKMFIKITDDENQLIHYELHKNSKKTILSKSQIVRAEDGYIEYEEVENSGKYYKLNINTQPVYVFINGVKKTDYRKENLQPNDSGMAEYIDYNNDNNIDFINIYNFNYNIVTDNIDIKNRIIFNKLSPINTVDLSDTFTTKYMIIKNGVQVDLIDIKPLDIINVAKEKDIYILFVRDNVVEGTISSVEDKKLIINDKSYMVSENYLAHRPTLLNTISFNKKITIRLDYLGQVAYIDNVSLGNKNFAYLIDIKEQILGTKEINLKYYDENGEMNFSRISSNVTIDGKKLDELMENGSSANSAINEIIELLCVRPNGAIEIPSYDNMVSENKTITKIIPRPAFVKLNKNKEIISIDTDAITHQNQEEEINDPNVLKAGVRNLKDQVYNPKARTLDGTYYADSSTIVLMVPDIDRYELDKWVKRFVPGWFYSRLHTNLYEKPLNEISNYSVVSASDLSENMQYDVQAYNIDPNTGIAQYMVVRGSYEYYYHKNNFQMPFAVFMEMTEYYDANEQKVIEKINYYLDGTIQSMAVDRDKLSPLQTNLIWGGEMPTVIQNSGKANETTTPIKVEGLKKGDIIGVEATNGYLSHIQRELNLSKINYKKVASYRPSSSRYPYSNGAYSLTAVDIPFDQRIGSSYSYTDTYNVQLGAALDLIGSSVYLRIPGKPGNALEDGTFAGYIGNEDSYQVWDKYCDLGGAKITVVEEISCNVSNDKCEYKIREGNISDIKTQKQTGDLYEASKIYGFSRYGEFSDVLIMNFKHQHNIYK